MPQVTAYLSPNGQRLTLGDGPATRLQVATIEGLVTLEREHAQGSWHQTAQSLQHLHLGALIFEPVSGRLLAGAHEAGGLWICEDGAGHAWREVTRGPHQRNIYGLAARHAAGRVTLFAGTEPSALYRSDDLGESWTEIPALRSVPGREHWTFPAPPHEAHVKCITMHPTEPRTFFVLVEQGALLKTEDDGEHFAEIDSYSDPGDAVYRDVHRLLINPLQPQQMYLATGVGVYRTDNAGESWSRLMRDGDRIGYPDEVLFDPNDHATVFITGARADPGEWFGSGSADPAILTSHDRGTSWHPYEEGLARPINASFEAACQHVWHDANGQAHFMLAVASAAGDVWIRESTRSAWAAVAKIAPVSKDNHYLTFLPEPQQALWMARRARAAGASRD